MLYPIVRSSSDTNIPYPPSAISVTRYGLDEGFAVHRLGNKPQRASTNHGWEGYYNDKLAFGIIPGYHPEDLVDGFRLVIRRPPNPSWP